MRTALHLAALALAVAVAVAGLVPTAVAAPVTRPVSWSVGDTSFDGVLVFDDASAAPRPAC